MVDRYGYGATNRYKTKVLNVPKPTTQPQLRRFIGLVNYLARFIDHLALHLQPLSSDWLMHPDITKEFFVFTDASKYGLGAMICQYDEEDKLKPVQFCSKVFTAAQQRWHCSEQEIFAVVYALEKWRYLLMHKKFTVYTDHKNLQTLFNNAVNFKSGKLYRWSVRLQDFHFHCKYIPYNKNKCADYLSRDALNECIDTSTKSDKPRDIYTMYGSHVMCELLCMSPSIRRVYNDTFDYIPCESHINSNECLICCPLNTDARNKRPYDYYLDHYNDHLNRSRDDVDSGSESDDSSTDHIPQKTTNKRFSKRLASKQSPFEDRNIQKLELIPTPTQRTLDEQQILNNRTLDQKVHDVKQLNDKILSYKGDVPAWNKSLLIPSAVPIRDYYRDYTPLLLREKQHNDALLYSIIHYLETNNTNLLRTLPTYMQRYVSSGRFKLIDNILHFQHGINDKDLAVIPGALIESTIRNAHSNLHHGHRRVLKLIRKRYWWPKMHKDVWYFCRSCDVCQKVKGSRKYGRHTGKMHLSPASKPFQQLSIDLVGPLPITASGNRYIVSIIDKFSRLGELDCYVRTT
eukprot:870965_1